MRYLVRAQVRPGRERALLQAIERGTLGQRSVAEGEYLRNMQDARDFPSQETATRAEEKLAGAPNPSSQTEEARWVEVCYFPEPLLEERPYWEEYFELVKVQDAHDRHKCRDWKGTEPWACGDCDCTQRLEERLRERGTEFLSNLRNSVQK